MGIYKYPLKGGKWFLLDWLVNIPPLRTEKRRVYLSFRQRNSNRLKKLLNVGDDGAEHSRAPGTARPL